MLKYKQWKELNESFLGPVTLGLGNVRSVGITGSQFTLEDLEAIEEAAKKGKKKMLGDSPEGGLEKLAGLKKKIKIDKDEIEDDDDELEGDEDDEIEDEIEDDDDELEGDEEDDDEDLDDKKDLGKKKVIDLGGEGPMFAKKGGKGCKSKKCGMKKGGKGCKGKKCEETMTAEDKAWWDSLTGQIASDPNKRYSDGTEYLEDSISPPDDPNSRLISDEPGPGEVGYAPTQRVGGTNPTGSWAGFSQIDSVEQGIRSEE
jgi:hypothetical protein